IAPPLLLGDEFPRKVQRVKLALPRIAPPALWPDELATNWQSVNVAAFCTSTAPALYSQQLFELKRQWSNCGLLLPTVVTAPPPAAKFPENVQYENVGAPSPTYAAPPSVAKHATKEQFAIRGLD